MGLLSPRLLAPHGLAAVRAFEPLQLDAGRPKSVRPQAAEDFLPRSFGQSDGQRAVDVDLGFPWPNLLRQRAGQDLLGSAQRDKIGAGELPPLFSSAVDWRDATQLTQGG